VLNTAYGGQHGSLRRSRRDCRVLPPPGPPAELRSGACSVKLDEMWGGLPRDAPGRCVTRQAVAGPGAVVVLRAVRGIEPPAETGRPAATNPPVSRIDQP
jgi:hypothetical protein